MNIGFLITARLKSTRLPLKVMKELNGEPMIQRIVGRAKQIHGIPPSDIIICTSPNPQDRPLIEVAEKTGVSAFLGDPDDVLRRLHDAALLHKLDYALGITADNPLFSIEYSNKIVDSIRQKKPDFVKIRGLPFGAATWGMNIKALRTICKVKPIIDTEIWGYLIDRPDLFHVVTIEAEAALRRPQYRLTLDYKEDYELLNHLYTHLPFDKTLCLRDVVTYLDAHPEIVAINQHCIQLDLDQTVKDHINRSYQEHYQEIQKIKQDIYAEKAT